jgi:predicted RNase H-like HicB family nuclease
MKLVDPGESHAQPLSLLRDRQRLDVVVMIQHTRSAMRYAIRIRKDSNDTFLVTVPDLPEAITFGETLDDAKRQAVDAIETAMMARIADHEPIPLTKATGRYYVDVCFHAT